MIDADYDSSRLVKEIRMSDEAASESLRKSGYYESSNSINGFTIVLMALFYMAIFGTVAVIWMYI